MTDAPVEARAWWWKSDNAVLEDFRNLLFLVWKHIGLPDPTPAQYELAYFLQHGWAGYATNEAGEIVHYFDDSIIEPTHLRRVVEPDPRGRSDILEAFRGIGKSYITASYVLWLLLKDPINTKVLVVSASGSKANEFVAQVKAIMLTMDLFANIRPLPGQRDKVNEFDVAGASLSQAPSLKARGITGQITGSRATHIIGDDIEVPDNSMTEDARLKLLAKVNEFDAIKVTGYAEVLLLGTPQNAESIYNRMMKERGYLCYCWPARYPKPEKRAGYVIECEGGRTIDILAPFVRRVDADPSLAYKPTDPERFDEFELAGREGKGRSFFALQYMLDTSLSDAERYPLKQHDLIVQALNPFKAPMTLQWGHDSSGRNRRHDLPNVGFTGDYFLGPLFLDDEWRSYEQSVLFVDPSGRGKDETAWVVLKVLNGMFYVLKGSGVASDPATAMRLIAEDAKFYNVSEIKVEPNYAGQVWIAAMQPILAEVWPNGCSVTEAEWAKSQKEVRIIETLEPLVTQHRLVVDESVARDQTLMYQFTHITRDRGALTHDDRVDALAGAVAFFTASLMVDATRAAEDQKRMEEERMIQDFVDFASRKNRHRFARPKQSGWRLAGQAVEDGDDFDDEPVCLRVVLH